MRVQLVGETDVDGFRRWARSLAARGVPPDDVHWRCGSGGDLFGDSALPPPADGDAPPVVRVPAFFLGLCDSVALHSDPQRFALLYRLLYRLLHEPSLRADPLDADIMLAQGMARAVAHDLHKMRAFVRFRPVADPARPDAPLHVAWFEPQHHIVEANAPWFRRRFANMRWALLTPRRCAEWDGHQLHLRQGARRADAPGADAGEQLWLAYYASIFNPARLKLDMMRKEMPRRYWTNLPEAALIGQLASAAAERTGAMVEGEPVTPSRRVRRLAGPTVIESETVDSLDTLRAHVAACTGCPLGAAATQAVMGEGATQPALMFVGEQPGDREDLAGRVFVGPAGQLLDRALAAAGIDRSAVFVTNAVRHFKYEMRGKRRIHKTPSQTEAAACARWLEHEIGLVQPRGLVALGSTAARSLLGRPVAIGTERGRWHARDDGLPVLVTTHPSAILRMAPAEQENAFGQFVADLREAGRVNADEHQERSGPLRDFIQPLPSLQEPKPCPAAATSSWPPLQPR